MLRKTTKEFIQESIKIHGKKYNYSKVDYKDAHTKVEIICPIHGSFWQTPDNHLHKKGCKICSYIRGAAKKSLTTKDFINKAKKVHKNYYTYSKVFYTNSCTKVIITCPIHGDFLQLPPSHLKGHGCPKCNNAYKKDTEDFIAEANLIHKNKYTYNKSIYLGNKKPVIITCPVHGDFKQKPSDHLKGKGCSLCAWDKLRLSSKQFIEKARKAHNDKYDYSKVLYKNSRSKVEIICPNHGSFWQIPYAHLAGTGCPICSDSKGEIFIYHYLKDNNIPFIPQYKIKDCRNKKPLPFDFAIFNEDGSLRCLIEYQGKQHFEPNEFFGGKKGFECILKTDIIKVDYCKNNKILLYHINYFDNIEEKLNQILKHF